MLDEFKEIPHIKNQVDKISKSYFNYVWRSEFPNVITAKFSKHKKCDECERCHAELEKASNEVQKRRIKARRAKHLAEVRIERRNYHNNRHKACVNPDKYLSIIVDGMDQSKTHLPKHTRVTGDDTNAPLLKVHLVGALAHGQNVPAFVFTSLEEWPNDSNLNITCIMKIFEALGWDAIKKKTVFVQLDNTCRENKNYTMARFFALLVTLRLVKEVR